MNKEYLDNEIDRIDTAINNYKKTLICILSDETFKFEDLNIIYEIIVRLYHKKEFLTELYAEVIVD